ncbi:MAG: hypothetical protein ACRCY8_18825 [Dermatophilaceae bacterium]
MWALLSAGVRRWLLLAVAVPLATMLVRAVRQHVEHRSGPTLFSRLLARLEHLGVRLSGRGTR